MRRADLLCSLCPDDRGINVQTLERVLDLAAEIRGGHNLGTMFIVSDAEAVLARSTCLILDPLGCYPDQRKRLEDPDLRGTVKALAQLDGAFIVSDDGVVLSACRYLNTSSEGITLPLGLGSRHMAAASITRQTRAVAVIVSESAVIRVFDAGMIVADIIPEMWLVDDPNTEVTSHCSSTEKK